MAEPYHDHSQFSNIEDESDSFVIISPQPASITSVKPRRVRSLLTSTVLPPSKKSEFHGDYGSGQGDFVSLQISYPPRHEVQAFNTDRTSDFTINDCDWSHSVKVLDVPPDLADLLELYMESRRYGGGTYKKLNYDPVARHLIVVFEEQHVAEHFLQVGHVVVNTHKFLVVEIRRPQKEEPNIVALEPMKSRSVLVTGIEPALSSELLTMYFENAKRSGGGPISKLNISQEEKKAFIEFADSEAAERVAQKVVHKVFSTELRVTLLAVTASKSCTGTSSNTDTGVQTLSCAIKVKGLGANISQEMLTMFFENRKRSGGGQLEDVFYLPDEGMAVLTFESPEVIDRIIQQHSIEPLKLSRSRLDIFPLVPVQNVSLSSSLAVASSANFDPFRLVASHLPMSVNNDVIKSYFARARSNVVNIVYSCRPGFAMIEFGEPYDYSELCQFVCLKPLKDVMIAIQKIEKPDCVQVRNFGNLTVEHLQLYFENPRLFGNVEVDIDQHDGYIVVKFADENVVTKVLNVQEHWVDGHKVVVTPYHECLGPVAPDASRGPCWIPADLTVNLQDHVVQFIATHPAFQSSIEKALVQTVPCSVVWPKSSASAGSSVTVQFVPPSSSDAYFPDVEKICETKLHDLLGAIESATVDVLQETWTEFRKKVNELSSSKLQLDRNDVSVEFCDSTCNVVVVGLRDNCQRVVQQLCEIKSDVELQHQKMSAIITEKMTNLKREQVQLLELYGMVDQLRNTGLTVEIRTDEPVISLTGSVQAIVEAKITCLQLLANAIQRSVTVDDYVLTLLKKQPFKDHVTKSLADYSVKGAVWYLSSNSRTVDVYGVDQRQIDKLATVLKSAFVRKEIPLDGPEMASLKLVEWKDCLGSMSLDYPALEIVQGETSLTLTCSSDIAGAVVERVQTYLNERTVRSEVVPVTSRGVVTVVELHLAENLAQICAKFASCGVKISPTSAVDPGDAVERGFLVSGTVHGLKYAVPQVREVVAKVVERIQSVHQPGIAQYLRSQRGRKNLDNIGNQFRAFIEEVLDEEDQSMRSSTNLKTFLINGRSQVLAAGSVGNVVLKIVVGDITLYKVDAIVNAANTHLDHSGGVARAIVEKGGREIQDECNAHIKKNGPLQPADSFVSKPGRLPCKAVIHAVGPIWTDGRHNEGNVLFQTVYDILSVSNGRKFSSVAMPAISTGIFRFPLDFAARVIIDAVKDFVKQQQAQHVKEIHLIDQSLQTANEFIRSAKAAGVELTVSAVEKLPGITSTTTNFATGYMPNQQKTFDTRANRINQPTSLPSITSGNTLVTPEGLKVTLVKGSLVEQQADVIVNTTSRDLNLANGAISRLILATAGTQIQTECQQVAPNGLAFGEVIVTKGYSLPCKFVYHGACRNWDSDGGQCEESMRAFIMNVLKKAHSSGLQSVAMPAIGTGNLRIPHDHAARWMFAEIEEFSRRYLTSSVRNIFLVIYNRDLPTIAAFEAELGTPSRNIPRKTNSVIKRGRTLEKSFSMLSSDSFAVKGKWTIKLNNVTLEVKQGDITRAATNIIVNSTNETLQLAQGAVSSAILDAAGPTIIQQCKDIVDNNKWVAPGLAVTSAGNLPSQYIFHVVATKAHWRDLVKNCLSHAEHLQLNSITFPLLGTGNHQKTSTEMASIMLDSLHSFSASKSPNHLMLVQIVIFSTDMYDGFQDALDRHLAKNNSLFRRATEFLGISSRRTAEVFDQPKVVERVDQAIRLRITALSESDVNSVVKEIDDVCSDMVKEQVIGHDAKDSETIAQLSDEQIARLTALENEFNVKVDVQKDSRVIKIRGLSENIAEVVPKVYGIFREVDHVKQSQMESNLISKEVQWMYQTDDGYEEYPVEINGIIETAHRSNCKTAEWEEQNSDRYVLEFATLTEKKVGDPANSVKVKRLTADRQLPKSWDLMSSADGLGHVRLNPACNEYKEVQQRVMSSANNSVRTILTIYRIQNETLYQQYTVRKDSMQRALQGSTVQVERVLWHGTSAETIESISLHGFNRSYCGKNAIVYGKGVYFARDFSYSAQNIYAVPDAQGQKHVYQTRVLTGEFVVGHQSYIVPPLKPGMTGETNRYNSVVDNQSNPQVFVIFSDTQAYPEYLIIFQ